MFVDSEFLVPERHSEIVPSAILEPSSRFLGELNDVRSSNPHRSQIFAFGNLPGLINGNPSESLSNGGHDIIVQGDFVWES